MGKAARNRAKEKRLKAKRSAKDARKALYESYARSGKNKKSKRSVNNAKRAKKMRSRLHLIIPCGNPACKKCYENHVRRIGKPDFKPNKESVGV